MPKYIIDLVSDHASIYHNGEKISEMKNTIKVVDGIIDYDISYLNISNLKYENNTDINDTYVVTKILDELLKNVNIEYDDKFLIIIPSTYSGRYLEEYIMFVMFILSVPMSNCTFIFDKYCVAYDLYDKWTNNIITSDDVQVTINNVEYLLDFNNYDRIQMDCLYDDNTKFTNINNNRSFEGVYVVDDMIYNITSDNIINGAQTFMKSEIGINRYVSEIYVNDERTFDSITVSHPCTFSSHINHKDYSDKYYSCIDRYRIDYMNNELCMPCLTYSYGIDIVTLYKDYLEEITIEKDGHFYSMNINARDNVMIKTTYRIYMSVDMCDRPLVKKVKVNQIDSSNISHYFPYINIFNMKDSMEFVRNSIEYNKIIKTNTDDYIKFIDESRRFISKNCLKFVTAKEIVNIDKFTKTKKHDIQRFIDLYILLSNIIENRDIYNHDFEIVKAKDYVKYEKVRKTLRDMF